MAVAVAVAVSGGVAVPVAVPKAVPVAGLTKRFFNQKDFLIHVWGYLLQEDQPIKVQSIDLMNLAVQDAPSESKDGGTTAEPEEGKANTQ